MALNHLYSNAKKYAAILDHHIKEADNAAHANKQLHRYSQPERTRIAAAIWSHPIGQNDLVYPTSPDQPQECEELVLNIQGYVLRALLPPLTSSAQLKKNPASAKQSLMLMGLGCDLFDKSAKAIMEIHSRFAANLPTDTLENWKPQLDEEFLCVELSNRYLTPDRLATSYDVVPFDETIDPFGLLRGVVGGKRTEDNVVLYYERIPDENNTFKYVACRPVLIKVGHLVEAQVSFSTVPISKGRHIMLCKLRSICVLNQQVYKDLNDITFESLKMTTKVNTKKVKRKVGYGGGSSNTEDTAQAMKKMRLDVSNGQGMEDDTAKDMDLVEQGRQAA